MKIGIIGNTGTLVGELIKALNSSAVVEDCIALNFEITLTGEPPTDLMLIPAGEIVTGRDGRCWLTGSRESGSSPTVASCTTTRWSSRCAIPKAT